MPGRGFASLTKEQRHEIASKGGKAAHAQGLAHRFTSEEAAEAGRKGGNHHSREHMRELGRKGGKMKQVRMREKRAKARAEEAE